MDDIRQDIRGNDHRSMTYAEIAAARGISADSAVRLVRRKRWQKQAGNGGTIRVLVPADEAAPASALKSRGHPGGHPGGYPLAPATDILPDIREAIREVMQPLAEQIKAANQRADGLQAKLDDTQAAERIARDEAAGLRAELDARRTWGLRRRLRWALGRRR